MLNSWKVIVMGFFIRYTSSYLIHGCKGPLRLKLFMLTLKSHRGFFCEALCHLTWTLPYEVRRYLVHLFLGILFFIVFNLRFPFFFVKASFKKNISFIIKVRQFWFWSFIFITALAWSIIIAVFLFNDAFQLSCDFNSLPFVQLMWNNNLLNSTYCCNSIDFWSQLYNNIAIRI